MTYDSKRFGMIVSRLRLKKGMTQEDLSAFAGISRSHLTDLENGKKTMRLDTLFRLCEALGTTPGRVMRMYEEGEE